MFRVFKDFVFAKSAYKGPITAGFTQVSNYRSEIWLAILAKTFQILLLIFFWSVIAKSSEIKISLSDLISYFFIANAVQVLVDGDNLRFARVITEEIKNGTISSYLLRPINAPFFVYTKFIGSQGLVILISLFLIILGLLLYFQGSLLKIFLFTITIIFALFCAFGLNLIIGSISFWTTESKGLKHVSQHIIRVLGGSLVPLSFFPLNIKYIILATPLPSLAYIPGYLIKGEITGEIIFGIISSFFWSIALVWLGLWIWKKGVKQYESIGI